MSSKLFAQKYCDAVTLWLRKVNVKFCMIDMFGFFWKHTHFNLKQTKKIFPNELDHEKRGEHVSSDAICRKLSEVRYRQFEIF